MKIAFVTPWYGANIPGGAESETRHTAEHLASAGMPVEILTTTIQDFFSDWSKNHYKKGQEQINGVLVRRFPVQKRDRSAFDAINWRLMQNLPITPEQEQLYIQEMFRTPQLYQYIRQHAAEYLFFFIPYMFASTYYGCQIYPEHSILIPCLHDESYARLGIYRRVFPQLRGMIFHTDAEYQLAESLYPASNEQIRPVLGEGVFTDWQGDAHRFRAKYGVEGDFILVVGRKDAGKNTPLLLQYWQRYQHQHHPAAQLIFIGPGTLPIPPQPQQQIRDLGFISLSDKRDAYAAATLLCQPSLNESFSLVVMESWVAGRPVLVHAHCPMTLEQCQKSNGGLYFADYDQFAATLNHLLSHPTIANQLGQQGRNYVLSHFSWPIIVQKYQQLIEQLFQKIKDNKKG